MDTDGGGWTLLVADNGKSELYTLPDTTPTPEKAGRVEIEGIIAPGISKVRFNMDHPDTSAISYISESSNGAQKFFDEIQKFMVTKPASGAFVELKTAGQLTPNIQYGEKNKCENPTRPMYRLYGGMNGHVWLLDHESGVTNAGSLVGSSYNTICNVPVPSKNYPEHLYRGILNLQQ